MEKMVQRRRNSCVLQWQCDSCHSTVLDYAVYEPFHLVCKNCRQIALDPPFRLHESIPASLIRCFFDGGTEFGFISKVQYLAQWRWNRAVVRPGDLSIREWLAIFNEYYFMGGLRGIVRVRWHDFDPADMRQGYTEADLDNAPFGVMISIDKRISNNVLLDVLLREATHATFWIFGCRCEKCYSSIGRSGANMPGRAPSFVEFACAVEDEANRAFPWRYGRWDLGVGSEGSLYTQELVMPGSRTRALRSVAWHQLRGGFSCRGSGQQCFHVSSPVFMVMSP